MSHHIVEAKKLGHRYPDGTRALEDVSFRITHGESVGIVGMNGAGKSTLLMHFAGVLLPTEGEVRVGEVPVGKKTLSLVRQSVGLVFQNPDDQLFTATVRDDVAFGPRNLRLPEEEVARRVKAALETVGMERLADRPPHKLSGGEKRAASIACVLSMLPDILVMDEPSSFLDPRSRRRLIDLLRSFTHTKIMASHDLDMILELCPRVIVLRDGRIAADGPAAEIFRDDALLESCGLEKPLSMKNCPVCGRHAPA